MEATSQFSLILDFCFSIFQVINLRGTLLKTELHPYDQTTAAKYAFKLFAVV